MISHIDTHTYYLECRLDKMHVNRTLNIILSNCLLFVLLQVCFDITYEYGFSVAH